MQREFISPFYPFHFQVLRTATLTIIYPVHVEPTREPTREPTIEPTFEPTMEPSFKRNFCYSFFVYMLSFWNFSQFDFA